MSRRTLGLHLQPADALVGTGRPSCLAEITADGRLGRIDLLEDDDPIVAAVGAAPALVVVDAPLAVPNATGRRDVEVVLSWLDCTPFPVSRRRAEQLWGGVRGERLAARLTGAGHDVAEGAPDIVLRQLRREAAGGGPPGEDVDLAAYRGEWLALRAPRYRPKGTGRASEAGLAEAHSLLARALGMGDPPPAPRDDWEAIAEAARLDAIALALTARRAVDAPERVLWLGTADRGRVVVPSDAAMRLRAAVNLDRLRAEGAIRI